MALRKIRIIFLFVFAAVAIQAQAAPVADAIYFDGHIITVNNMTAQVSMVSGFPGCQGGGRDI